uniref:Uncharacterized protein n=1 Tax=Rhizophora mucronata TaxID=61149 RepID=A0A2P2JB98_RHIMU
MTKLWHFCLNPFLSLCENSLQASMLRSMAAASATKAAASSVQFTCCTPISTSGLLLRRPLAFTVDDITKPLNKNCETKPAPNSDSDPDPDPDPDPKSQLLCGLLTGVASLLVLSTVNVPPVLVLTVELATMVVAGVATLESRSNSNRYPSAPCSRHTSSRPQGLQVPCDGWRISHAPGLDWLTRLEPGDGTNGVTIDAIATGEPERS